MLSILSKSLICAFLLLSLGCSHIEVSPYGIQKDHIAFVPARIAVLPCIQWPYGARYLQQDLSNFTLEEAKQVCDGFDSFVLSGFKGQPYMRGLSPNVVNQLLKKNARSTMLSEIPSLWHQQEGDCTNCSNSVAYYQKSIAPRARWQKWLGQLSRNVYNIDAILIPLVLYSQKGRTDDRGLAVAYKKIGISLFLIDTNNGRLIWAGGRDVIDTNKMLDSDRNLNQLKLPSWEQVASRLFASDIWSEFPGRQNY